MANVHRSGPCFERFDKLGLYNCSVENALLELGLNMTVEEFEEVLKKTRSYFMCIWYRFWFGGIMAKITAKYLIKKGFIYKGDKQYNLDAGKFWFIHDFTDNCTVVIDKRSIEHFQATFHPIRHIEELDKILDFMRTFYLFRKTT